MENSSNEKRNVMTKLRKIGGRNKFISKVSKLRDKLPDEGSLPYSIFVTLLCCPPLGLWSLYNTYKAYEENKKQNEREAKLFNEKIRIANIFGVVIGLLIWIIITIYVIAHLTFLQQATSHFTAMAQNEAQIFYKDYRKPYDAEHP